MFEPYSADFIYTMNELARQVNGLARRNGFWDSRPGVDRTLAKLALIHAEVSEVLEEVRKVEPVISSKLPGFAAVEEELADVVIRCLDFAAHEGIRLPEAILAKHEYNKTRPYRHGKAI